MRPGRPVTKGIKSLFSKFFGFMDKRNRLFKDDLSEIKYHKSAREGIV
jgi:hypothetical protein